MSANNYGIGRRFAPRSVAPSQASIFNRIPRKVVLAYLVFLMCLSWGIPTVFVGIPHYTSIQLEIVILFPLIACGIFTSMLKAELGWWKWVPLIFVMYCYIVSFISSTYYIPQPFSWWAPGLVYVLPLLVIFAAYQCGVNAKHIVDAILISALIGSAIIIIDHFVRLPYLDYYSRASVLGEARRAVVLKNEMVLSIVILVSRIVNSKGGGYVKYAAALIAVGYALIGISESRLGTAAALLGVLLYMIFIYNRKNKLFLIVAAAICMLALTPFVLSKYISHVGSVTSITDFKASDPSVRFRLVESAHFENYFDRTHGLGFGLMSASPNKMNIISSSIYQAGEVYGAKSYPVSLGDLAFWGALYQFGYVGFAFSIGMTVIICVALIKVGRTGKYALHDDVGAIGAATVAFMISPLPMNFITLDWTLTTGGVLWCLAAIASREAGQSSWKGTGLHRTCPPCATR